MDPSDRHVLSLSDNLSPSCGGNSSGSGPSLASQINPLLLPKTIPMVNVGLKKRQLCL